MRETDPRSTKHKFGFTFWSIDGDGFLGVPLLIRIAKEPERPVGKSTGVPVYDGAYVLLGDFIALVYF